MNPLKFLRHFWDSFLVIPNSPAPQENMRQASNVTRICRPFSNIKFFSTFPAPRLHRKKKLPHKGNPAFPTKHHRFKPTMDAVRLHQDTRLPPQ